MIKVALQGIKVFANHGFYPEEQVWGNHFVVDVSVQFPQVHHFTSDNISQTVNYEHLHQIVNAEMAQPRQLLETVVQAIIDKIKTDYCFAHIICVSLKKLNPPLKGEVACSLVEITYTKPDDSLQ